METLWQTGHIFSCVLFDRLQRWFEISLLSNCLLEVKKKKKRWLPHFIAQYFLSEVKLRFGLARFWQPFDVQITFYKSPYCYLSIKIHSWLLWGTITCGTGMSQTPTHTHTHFLYNMNIIRHSNVSQGQLFSGSSGFYYLWTGQGLLC